MVPRVNLEIRLHLGRKCVCVYTLRLQIADNPHSMIQPRSCLVFYPESVSLELGGAPFRNCLVSWAFLVSWSLHATLWQDKAGLRSFVNEIFASCSEALMRKIFLSWEVYHEVLGLRVHVRNKSNGSNHVEVSLFTSEAISWKMFRRLTKVKLWKMLQLHMAWRKCISFSFLGRKSVLVTTMENIDVPSEAHWIQTPIRSVTQGCNKLEFHRSMLQWALDRYSTMLT